MLANRDDRKARDEGRSVAYDAEERNAASARFCRNPKGAGFAGGLLRCAPCEGNDHSLRRTPCIPPRKTERAAMRDLFSVSPPLPCLRYSVAEKG